MLNQLPADARTHTPPYTHTPHHHNHTSTHSLKIYFQRGNHFYELDQKQPKLMSTMYLSLNVLIVPSLPLRAVAELMNVSFIRNLGRTLFFKIPTTECFIRVPFSINEPSLSLKDVLAGGAASISSSAVCLYVTCSFLFFSPSLHIILHLIALITNSSRAKSGWPLANSLSDSPDTGWRVTPLKPLIEADWQTGAGVSRHGREQ